MITKSVIFMVESGRALDLVKQHIAERRRVSGDVRAMADELGTQSVFTDRSSGVLTGIDFGRVAPHVDFKKPNKYGASYPKKGSDWARRFKEQLCYANPAEVIAREFDVPMTIHYKTDGGEGWRHIGGMMAECGWLYLSADGPYAMWVPDVEAEVAEDVARGNTVSEPAASFVPKFDGCRRVEHEEWDILVAQHALAKKQALKAVPA